MMANGSEGAAFTDTALCCSPGELQIQMVAGARNHFTHPAPATNSMSDRYFVDTNILMYAHDNTAGEKHEREKTLVEELWRERKGVVRTQVLQELVINLRRKAARPLDTRATRELVADYLTCRSL